METISENTFVVLGQGGVLLYAYPETYERISVLSALLGAIDALITEFFGKSDFYKVSVGKKELVLIRKEQLILGVLKSPQIPDDFVKEKLISVSEIVSQYIISPKIGIITPEIREKLNEIARKTINALDEYEKQLKSAPQLQLPPSAVIYLTEKGEQILKSPIKRKEVDIFAGARCIDLIQMIDGIKTILELAKEFEIIPKEGHDEGEYNAKVREILRKLHLGKLEDKRIGKEVREFVQCVNYLYVNNYISTAPFHYVVILLHQKFLRVILRKICPFISKYLALKIIKNASNSVLKHYPDIFIVDLQKMNISTKIISEVELRKKALKNELSLEQYERIINALRSLISNIFEQIKILLGDRILSELKERTKEDLIEIYEVQLQV